MSASLAAWQRELTSGPEPKHVAVGQTASLATEEELIAQSRAGNLRAFGEIYDRYEGAVFRHAFHVLGHADDADDVRQETFVRAFAALTRFRGEASMKTYLLAICSNLCRDKLRNKQRRPEWGYGIVAPDTVTGEAGGDPLQAMQRAHEASQVRRALDKLPAPAREILILRHVEELEFDEIAVVLGCSRVSAPVRLFRARRLFKDVYVSLIEVGEE